MSRYYKTRNTGASDNDALSSAVDNVRHKKSPIDIVMEQIANKEQTIGNIPGADIPEMPKTNSSFNGLELLGNILSFNRPVSGLLSNINPRNTRVESMYEKVNKGEGTIPQNFLSMVAHTPLSLFWTLDKIPHRDNTGLGEDMAAGLASMLSGDATDRVGKIDGKELLNQWGWHDNTNGGKDDGMFKSWNNVGRGLTGFALDVGLDPTTYLTFGLGAVAKGGAKVTATETLRNAVKVGAEEAVRHKAAQSASRLAEIAAKRLEGTAGRDLAEFGIHSVDDVVRNTEREAAKSAIYKAMKEQVPDLADDQLEFVANEMAHSGMSDRVEELARWANADVAKEAESLANRTFQTMGRKARLPKGFGVELPFTKLEKELVSPQRMAALGDKLGISKVYNGTLGKVLDAAGRSKAATAVKNVFDVNAHLKEEMFNNPEAAPLTQLHLENTKRMDRALRIADRELVENANALFNSMTGEEDEAVPFILESLDKKDTEILQHAERGVDMTEYDDALRKAQGNVGVQKQILQWIVDNGQHFASMEPTHKRDYIAQMAIDLQRQAEDLPPLPQVIADTNPRTARISDLQYRIRRKPTREAVNLTPENVIDEAVQSPTPEPSVAPAPIPAPRTSRMDVLRNDVEIGGPNVVDSAIPNPHVYDEILNRGSLNELDALRQHVLERRNFLVRHGVNASVNHIGDIVQLNKILKQTNHFRELMSKKLADAGKEQIDYIGLMTNMEDVLDANNWPTQSDNPEVLRAAIRKADEFMSNIFKERTGLDYKEGINDRRYATYEAEYTDPITGELRSTDYEDAVQDFGPSELQKANDEYRDRALSEVARARDLTPHQRILDATYRRLQDTKAALLQRLDELKGEKLDFQPGRISSEDVSNAAQRGGLSKYNDVNGVRGVYAEKDGNVKKGQLKHLMPSANLRERIRFGEKKSYKSIQTAVRSGVPLQVAVDAVYNVQTPNSLLNVMDLLNTGDMVLNDTAQEGMSLSKYGDTLMKKRAELASNEFVQRRINDYLEGRTLEGMYRAPIRIESADELRKALDYIENGNVLIPKNNRLQWNQVLNLEFFTDAKNVPAEDYEELTKQVSRLRMLSYDDFKNMRGSKGSIKQLDSFRRMYGYVGSSLKEQRIMDAVRRNAEQTDKLKAMGYFAPTSDQVVDPSVMKDVFPDEPMSDEVRALVDEYSKLSNEDFLKVVHETIAGIDDTLRRANEPASEVTKAVPRRARLRTQLTDEEKFNSFQPYVPPKWDKAADWLWTSEDLPVPRETRGPSAAEIVGRDEQLAKDVAAFDQTSEAFHTQVNGIIDEALRGKSSGKSFSKQLQDLTDHEASGEFMRDFDANYAATHGKTDMVKDGERVFVEVRNFDMDHKGFADDKWSPEQISRVRKIAKLMRGVFLQWGVDESQADQLGDLMSNYVFHTIAWEKKAQRKLAQKGEKEFVQTSQSMLADNRAALHRLGNATIDQMNNIVGANSGMGKMLESMISRIAIERGMLHNRVMYFERYANDTLSMFGRKVTIGEQGNIEYEGHVEMRDVLNPDGTRSERPTNVYDPKPFDDNMYYQDLRKYRESKVGGATATPIRDAYYKALKERLKPDEIRTNIIDAIRSVKPTKFSMGDFISEWKNINFSLTDGMVQKFRKIRKESIARADEWAKNAGLDLTKTDDLARYNKYANSMNYKGVLDHLNGVDELAFRPTTALNKIEPNMILVQPAGAKGTMRNSKTIEVIDTALKYAEDNGFNPEETQKYINEALANSGESVQRDFAQQMYSEYDPKAYSGGAVYAIPKVIYDHMMAAAKTQSEKDIGSFVKLLDKFMGIWKLNATVINPGFHVRNALSNTFNNWLNLGAEALNPYTSGKAMEALRNDINPDSVLRLNDGTTISLRKVKRYAERYGIMDAKTLDSMLGTDSAIQKMLDQGNSKGKQIADALNPLSQNAAPYRLGRKVGGVVENHARMANFIGNLRQGKSFEEAAQMTDKYLFDYSDLTAFEKNFMARVFPFYTWMRKNAGLQYSELMRDPKRYSKIIKAYRNASAGYDPDRDDNRPPWLQNAISLGGDGKTSSYLNASFLPFMDLGKGPKDYLAGINPLLKIGIEQATNTDLFFGSPIESYTGQTKDLPQPVNKALSALPDSALEALGMVRGPGNSVRVPAKTAQLLKSIPGMSNWDKTLSPALDGENKGAVSYDFSWLTGFKKSNVDEQKQRDNALVAFNQLLQDYQHKLKDEGKYNPELPLPASVMKLINELSNDDKGYVGTKSKANGKKMSTKLSRKPKKVSALSSGSKGRRKKKSGTFKVKAFKKRKKS